MKSNILKYKINYFENKNNFLEKIVFLLSGNLNEYDYKIILFLFLESQAKNFKSNTKSISNISNFLKIKEKDVETSIENLQKIGLINISINKDYLLITLNEIRKINNTFNIDKKITKDEIIKNIEPKEFILKRTNRKASKKELEMIDFLLKKGVSKEFINILIDFSFIKNNSLIVTNYIIKIAESIIKNNFIFTSEELKSFLRKTNQKKKTQTISDLPDTDLEKMVF